MQNEDRQAAMHEKGFDILKTSTSPVDSYARLKMGGKTYKEALIDPEYYDKLDYRGYRDKEFIIRALINNDLPTLREISRYFYRTNGIYQKVVNYFATMYRYDWYMVPEIFAENIKEDKVTSDFLKVLSYFDNSNVKKLCGEIALSVIRDGVCYLYGYEGEDNIIVQELPYKWCRSKYKIKGIPAVEFNMSYFDTKYPDAQYRMRILDLWPPEFKKGYILYKEHKLPYDGTTPGQTWGCWYLLDPVAAFKFSLMGLNGLPLFVNAVPSIIDLDLTQGIDRQRQLQQLLKIIVQLLPLDKNGDLIFDIDEARDIHNNAVEMLSNAIGVDVLTTFADVKAIEVSDANQTVTDNSLDNAERTVFNNFGSSKNIFNTQGNLALQMSILEDEGTLKDLNLQIERMFNAFAQRRSAKPKQWKFRFYLLGTTQYNYQALSKLYKEQTQIGFSKMLPQIALGQSQSFILNTAFFENNILYLTEVMLPPLMSSTMSPDDIKELGQSRTTAQDKKSANNASGETGRPKKEQSELSEKTIQNQESMS